MGRAELLYFKEGGRVQSPATLEAGKVRLETPLGRFAFGSEDFLKVVPGFNPEGEWESRRAEGLAGDVDQRMSSAWWALRNGLVEGATELIRASGRSDPIASSLNGTLDRLEGPRADPDTIGLETALGVPLKATRGVLVELLHQEDEAAAIERVAHLERVVRAYYLWFGFLGVDLKGPTRRLVFVQLHDRRDYLRFLTSQSAGAFSNTMGYYHPTFRAVLAYDLGEPSRPVSRPTIEGPTARRRLLADCDRAAKERGTASHEMIHLLVVESGLDPDSTRFPLWLHEGLAAQFEVVRGGRWAGIGQAHDLRLSDWRSAEPVPRLAPLLRDAGFGQGYRRETYAASWGLVNYLGNVKPKEFVAFLDLLRGPETDPSMDRAERSSKCFRQAMNEELSGVETDWRAYLSGLKTPLESRDPSVPGSRP